MLECMHRTCEQPATHVVVDYHHNVVGDEEVYCKKHAFEEGREECPCCYDYDINVSTESGSATLLPTYPAGTLDNEGCCSEHP